MPFEEKDNARAGHSLSVFIYTSQQAGWLGDLLCV